MSYPVILKKNNKPLKEFKTIKEMAEFIKWDYQLLYYYVMNDKRTDDGFTFKINLAQIKKHQENLVKKLNEHHHYWRYSKTLATAKHNAEEYIVYANEILDDPEMYKNTVMKMKPILNTKPFFNYLYRVCKIDEYNERLASLKQKMSEISHKEMITIHNMHRRFKVVMDFIHPNHIECYLDKKDGCLTFKEEELYKENTLILTKEEKLSLMCLKSLIDKFK
jgi:hypothetical protein